MHRKFRLLVIIAIVTLLSVLYYGINARGRTMLKNNLLLTVELDKNTYYVGENMKIRYVITNNGNSDLYFINWDHGFRSEWIHMFDASFNELETIPKVIYKKKLFLDRDMYVLIKSGESFATEIIGEVGRGIFKKHGRIPHEGLGIDFGDSAIMTKGPGIYYIEGRYETKNWDVDNGKERYGLDNIWIGKLKSNMIEITIQQ